MQIAIAQPFPSFSLPAIDNLGNKTTESNETLKGKKWVLFVYPKDQTSGCTIEACNFRDMKLEFEALGIEVFGISRDTIRSHSNFIAKQSLTYPLLSDEGGVWLKANGLISDGTMYGKPVTRVARTTFFVDEEGIVRQIWEKVTPLDHASQVLEWIKSNL
jgi:peroxiredoxin Q/BCP